MSFWLCNCAENISTMRMITDLNTHPRAVARSACTAEKRRKSVGTATIQKRMFVFPISRSKHCRKELRCGQCVLRISQAVEIKNERRSTLHSFSRAKALPQYRERRSNQR